MEDAVLLAGAFLTVMPLWGITLACVTTGLSRIFCSVGQEGKGKLMHGLIRRCSVVSVSVSDAKRDSTCPTLLAALCCCCLGGKIAGSLWSKRSEPCLSQTCLNTYALLSKFSVWRASSRDHYKSPNAETDALLLKDWSRSCVVASLPFTWTPRYKLEVLEGHWKEHIIKALT